MYYETDLDKIDISWEPPREEPARQYYFLAKCRKLVEKEAERIGRPLTFCVTTFGCPFV